MLETAHVHVKSAASVLMEEALKGYRSSHQLSLSLVTSVKSTIAVSSL